MKTRRALPAASGIFEAKSLTLSTARSVTLRTKTEGDVAWVAAGSVTLDIEDFLPRQGAALENQSWGDRPVDVKRTRPPLYSRRDAATPLSSRRRPEKH